MAYYTPEQLDKMRNSLKSAKENPDDPKSQEIFKRINSGQMNFELKALGIEPVKVERPKVDMKQAFADVQLEKGQQSMIPEPEPKSRATRVVQDVPSDLQETAQAIRKSGEQMGQEIYDIATDDDFTLAQKFMGVLGSTAKGVAGGLGEATMGLGKTFMTPEAEARLGQIVRDAGQAVGETELAQKIVPEVTDWYSSLSKDDKLFVDSAGGMGMVIAEMFGVGKAKKPLQMAGEGMRQTGEFVAENAPQAGRAIQQGLEGAARATGEVIDQSMAATRAARVAEQEAKATEAVGRILQAGDDQRAIDSAKRALSEMDTTGVETYDDLNNTINDQIKGYSRAVDLELDKVPGTFTKDDLVKTTQVGDELVVENPVGQAIQGLIEAYTKSGDAVDATRVRQLATKFENEGLTLREVNELAREYGIEYRDRAFTKMGDPKTGYNAENYENIRSGVKDVLRSKMPDDATKELDRKISDLYTTRDLTAKIEDKIAKLEQRVKNRTMSQKFWNSVADVADLATFGGLRGVLTRLLPSNVGNKAMNSIDIQDELRQNLDELTRLAEMKDDKKFADAFEEYMKNLPVGMSIRDVSSDVTDDIIMENLMRLDNMEVDPADTIRLDELKRIAEQRALTENEMLEARAIVENSEGSLPIPETNEQYQ